MDTTQTITHLGLCAGYDGIGIGLERVIPTLRTVALCEIEAFAIANLVAKMEAGLLDAAPIWTNLKTFPWQQFRGKVDILSGGYPCQPFSAAGKRAGKEDERHLWPWIADGISILQPSICFFENVEGHITLGLREVIEDLEGLGYKATWGIFSAAEVGAPHQRKRVFILAYRNDTGLEGWHSTIMRQCAGELLAGTGGASAWPSHPGESQYGWEPPRVVANSHEHRDRQSCGWKEGEGFGVHHQESVGMEESAMQGWEGGAGAGLQPNLHRSADANGGIEAGCYGEIESPVGRDTSRSAGGMGYAELCVSCDNRTDELRLLGNGVVPATAALAFRTLMQELTPCTPTS